MAAALATSWMLGAAPAHAQVTSEPSAVVFPDPTKFAHGFFTEGEFGVLSFSGRASDEIAPGFAVGARAGYDIFSFFAVQLHLLGSTHQSQGDTPIAGQLLQVYQGTVEGKLTLRLVQWSFFVEGGLGAARMSSNLLYARGSRSTAPASPTAEAAASITTSCRATSRSACAATSTCSATSPAAGTWRRPCT